MSQKTNVYLAVFRSLERGSNTVACGGNAKFSSTNPGRDGWPYDAGDDPAFLSEHKYGSGVTWGVCRPQVRNTLNEGDVVVFFSVRGRRDEAPFDYRLCAICTVERKIRHTEIWNVRNLRPFTRYNNLLIRPLGKRKWEHHEPAEEVSHKDWIWRLAERRGLKKSDFQKAEVSNCFVEGQKLRRGKLRVASNYVIFSKSKIQTLVLKNPVSVATCHRNGYSESWHGFGISRKIHELTLLTARKHGNRRKSLRSTNIQHAHPTIRWKMLSQEASEWRSNLIRTLRGR